MIKLFQVVEQQKSPKTIELRRLNKQFLGLGHVLEAKRKERRRVQLQEQTIENRVLSLQKQDIKIRKSIQEKQNKMMKMLMIKQRQLQEKQQKQLQKKKKEEQLERAKKKNQYMKMIHKTNINSILGHLKSKNSEDYKYIKQKSIEGQSKRKQYRYEDINRKRENYFSILSIKDNGRKKIDKFFKTKNYEHMREYSERLKTQQRKTVTKIKSIHRLQSRQSELKAKVQQNSLRASRIEETFKRLTKTIDDTISENKNIKGRLQEKDSSTIFGSLTQRNSQTDKQNNEQIQENILNLEDGIIETEVKLVRKRNKNKHVNRKKKYEQF